MSAWSNSMLVMDRQLGPVVEELGALVEEGGVVLVALHDDVGALGPARKPASKFRAMPPTMKPGSSPAASSSQAIRRGGGRLAVGAGDHEARLAPSRKRSRASGRDR